MRDFARLYAELDASNGTTAKVAALVRYFERADPADAAWAVYFLSGGKPRQVVPTGQLRALAIALAGIHDWLFEECYQAVGDLAETIALVLPPPSRSNSEGLAHWVEQRLLPRRGQPPDAQASLLREAFDELDTTSRFLLVKLIGGSFRVGVSRLLVQRALAEVSGLDPKLVAQRMMGWTAGATALAAPSAERYLQLVSPDSREPCGSDGRPYPFFLAHSIELPLEHFADRLGDPADWLVEWKYDGIRAQLVRRAGNVWIWSRGEELVTERFPEVVHAAQALPDGTVLDGELVVWKDGRPAPFALLQQRIGRKTLTKKVLAEAPVGFMAYDILEWQCGDVRDRPQRARRVLLEQAVEGTALHLSPLVTAADWLAHGELRARSRELGVEGFMLKHAEAAYGTGRRKQEGLAAGTWWKWKIDPLSVDCVLIYAQAGHGRRASVYTDYTFAVWNRPPRDAAEAQAVVDAIARREAPAPDGLHLVPFAKAYSGLTDEEFRRIDAIIRRTTLEKFGPVRSLKPSLVFELGFEGINRSARHKSGIAVRFPRMLRIRDDKPLHEADSLQTLESLLALTGSAGAAR
jgi:DNA ligase-1